MMQQPTRFASVPAALCTEAVAITKDVFVAAESLWSLCHRVMSDGDVWPGARNPMLPNLKEMTNLAHGSWFDPMLADNEIAYAATASPDSFEDIRRVIDTLRSATVEDDNDRFGDPLASPWDDVVRRPRPMFGGFEEDAAVSSAASSA